MTHGHRSNTARRRRQLRDTDSVVTDGHLTQGPNKLQKALRGAGEARDRKLISRDERMGQFLTDDPELDEELDGEIEQVVEVRAMPQVKSKTSVSESADVIFNPCTQQTRYSSRHAVKQNLERRMYGFLVNVHDIYGEGQVDLTISTEMEVGNLLASVVAKCIASSYDMAVRTVRVVCDGRTYDVRPADRARSPEDTKIFLERLVANVVAGHPDEDIPI